MCHNLGAGGNHLFVEKSLFISMNSHRILVIFMHWDDKYFKKGKPKCLLLVWDIAIMPSVIGHYLDLEGFIV